MGVGAGTGQLYGYMLWRLWGDCCACLGYTKITDYRNTESIQSNALLGSDVTLKWATESLESYYEEGVL